MINNKKTKNDFKIINGEDSITFYWVIESWVMILVYGTYKEI